jgi:hypothetical protein
MELNSDQVHNDINSLHGMGMNINVLLSAAKGLEDAQLLCHLLSRKSGWWEGLDPMDKHVFGTKIALIHSEISEAMEGGRKSKMDDHLPERRAEEVELADALIRIFDLAGARDLDLAGAVMQKLVYNQHRADHKPENRAKEGGKGF